MEEKVAPYMYDPDFEPQRRQRSGTWPLNRPDFSLGHVDRTDSAAVGDEMQIAESEGGTTSEMGGTTVEMGGATVGVGGATGGTGGASPQKGTGRRNAWGTRSYAELISQAIQESPEKRLTLAQIYEWIVQNVPYFKDKGDSNSSAGWKNSIRHNLSLHSKFLRVQNESTGKSSWWTLNPDGGKSGKSSRPRAGSMDNASKLHRSRVRALQARKQQMSPESDGVCTDPPGEGQAESPNLDDIDVWTSFRPRSDSNASVRSGRVSPHVLGTEEDSEYSYGSIPPTVNEMLMEELDLMHGLSLMTSDPSFTPFQNNSSNFGNSIFSPTSSSSSYQESDFRPHAPSRLAALLTSDSPPPSDILLMQSLMQPSGTGLLGFGTNKESAVAPVNMTSAQLGNQTVGGVFSLPCGINRNFAVIGQTGPQSPTALPTDLDVEMFTENLDCDVEYIINSELMDGEGLDFNFDPSLPPHPSTAASHDPWSQRWVSG